jgi:alanine-glyoxylate transaminase/(R)-3-amino-2-methylpropionate-pyruvate transaminase
VGGAVQFPRDFVKRTAELVRASGGLVVSDEVQTGFGRTGSNYWGFQNHGIVPDIVTMAKGIGNGIIHNKHNLKEKLSKYKLYIL